MSKGETCRTALKGMRVTRLLMSVRIRNDDSDVPAVNVAADLITTQGRAEEEWVVCLVEYTIKIFGAYTLPLFVPLFRLLASCVSSSSISKR